MMSNNVDVLMPWIHSDNYAFLCIIYYDSLCVLLYATYSKIGKHTKFWHNFRFWNKFVGCLLNFTATTHQQFYNFHQSFCMLVTHTWFLCFLINFTVCCWYLNLSHQSLNRANYLWMNWNSWCCTWCWINLNS